MQEAARLQRVSVLSSGAEHAEVTIYRHCRWRAQNNFIYEALCLVETESLTKSGLKIIIKFLVVVNCNLVLFY